MFILHVCIIVFISLHLFLFASLPSSLYVNVFVALIVWTLRLNACCSSVSYSVLLCSCFAFHSLFTSLLWVLILWFVIVFCSHVILVCDWLPIAQGLWARRCSGRFIYVQRSRSIWSCNNALPQRRSAGGGWNQLRWETFAYGSLFGRRCQSFGCQLIWPLFFVWFWFYRVDIVLCIFVL